jgi:hypothetical protein
MFGPAKAEVPMFRMTLILVVMLTAAVPAGAQNLDELRKQKLDAAGEAYRLQLQMYEAGRGNLNLDQLNAWSMRWLEAAKHLDPKADPVPHLVAHLDRIRKLEEIVQAQFKAGQVTRMEVLAATYYRLEAQILLEQVKAKKKG